MAGGMRMRWGIPETIGKMLPSARWVCRDNDYNQLEWFSDDIPKPSIETILEKQAEYEALEPMRCLREIRDWYIQQCDWTQGADIRALRGAEWCLAWDTYRQQLRDLPSSGVTPYFDEMDFIQGITWPEKPNLS